MIESKKSRLLPQVSLSASSPGAIFGFFLFFVAFVAFLLPQVPLSASSPELFSFDLNPRSVGQKIIFALDKTITGDVSMLYYGNQSTTKSLKLTALS